MVLMNATESLIGGRAARVSPEARREQVARIAGMADADALTFQTRGEGKGRDWRVLVASTPLCDIIARVCRDGSRMPHALPVSSDFSANDFSSEAWEQWWNEGGAAMAAKAKGVAT